MSPDPCLNEQELAGLTAGRFPPERRSWLVSHLAACDACRSQAADAWRALQGQPSRKVSIHSLWGRRSLRGAAAAILAVAGSGLIWISLPREGKISIDPRWSSAQRVREIPRELSRAGSYRFQDGTLLALENGAAVRCHAPGEGGRTTLELVQGTIETEIPPASGRLRVQAAAGEIQVLGTRFRATAGRLGSLGLLCVDVLEGKVALQNRSGRVEVAAAGRGLALADRAPVHLDQRGTRRKVLERFLPMLGPSVDGKRLDVRPGLERDAETLAALFWYLPPQGAPPTQTIEERAALELLERMKGR